MLESALFGLTSILVLGITAQWLAWRTRIPSILILLFFGFLAGPIFNMIHPQDLLGDLFFPTISILVSIIVFEGGLSLKVADLKEIGKMVRNIVIFGTLLTFVIISCASYYILGLNYELSVMFGAMMVITGPTVIVPLLRHVNLKKQLASVIRWEGILIAPVGAILIVMVYQFIFAASGLGKAAILLTLVKTLLIGGGIGVGTALLILILIRKNWIPDFLQEVISLMLVICCYTGSNLVQSDSGLVAVVMMGLLLANQQRVVVRHILVFKENLRILAISSLFIMLSASLELSTLFHELHWNSVLFLVVLILFARPIPLFLSTIGTPLTLNEKLFMSWMAPRGIVTASIASLFALRLVDQGVPGAEALVPLTFIVIITTVSLYGGTAERVQNWLKLSMSGSGDVFLVGANKFAKMLGLALKEQGITVHLVDTNKPLVMDARANGLTAYNSNVMSDQILEEIKLGSVSSFLAMTASDEVNMLSAIQYTEVLGRDNVFRLIPDVRELKYQDMLKKYEQGRFLFGKGSTFTYLSTRVNTGSEIRAIDVEAEFNLMSFKEEHGDRAILLAVISPDKKVQFCTLEQEISAEIGAKLLVLL